MNFINKKDSLVCCFRLPVCDWCEGNGQESAVLAVKHCAECGEYLCDECCRAHDRMKKFKGHQAKDIETRVCMLLLIH